VTKVEIATADGTSPAYVFRPEGAGPFPAAIVYMDAFGIRPAMLEIGERLAANGILALVPDLFYRSGPYEPMDPGPILADPEKRKAMFERFMGPATPEAVMSDTRAYLDYLAARSDVKPGPVGVNGYCMGGRLALIAVGTYPDRFAAMGSFHGGRLATDEPNSPHLLAPKIAARVYVAGAIEDSGFDDAQKARLEAALTDAGVTHAIETYPAKHGWVFRDLPVYDAAAAERHWDALLGLYAETIGA
jgi:carboxymethylenebutenolidase